MSQWRKHKIDKVAAGHPKSHDAHNETNPRRELERGRWTAHKLLHGGVDVVATASNFVGILCFEEPLGSVHGNVR